jgi:hypothetical protein
VLAISLSLKSGKPAVPHIRLPSQVFVGAMKNERKEACGQSVKVEAVERDGISLDFLYSEV